MHIQLAAKRTGMCVCVCVGGGVRGCTRARNDYTPNAHMHTCTRHAVAHYLDTAPQAERSRVRIQTLTGIFHWHRAFSHTMALGSIRSL